MSFDRVHADRKLVRNFLIGRSPASTAQHLSLTRRQSRCGSQRVGKSARLLKRRMLRPLGSKCQNGRGELARIAGFENVRVSGNDGKLSSVDASGKLSHEFNRNERIVSPMEHQRWRANSR